MGNIVWLIVDVASFVIFAAAGIMLLVRRGDAPTLDKTKVLPDSSETDFAPMRAFSIGAGAASLVFAAVMFAAVPAVLWATETAAWVITAVVCGAAAVGAVALFFPMSSLSRRQSARRREAKRANLKKTLEKSRKIVDKYARLYYYNLAIGEQSPDIAP